MNEEVTQVTSGEFGHIPDSGLYYEWQHGMEGIDQTYIEWLESELRVAREFQRAYQQLQIDFPAEMQLLKARSK